MEDLLGYVIRGIPFGCVFGLVAVGLVLTYKTSGVFNLAFAAQAFLSAAVFYDAAQGRRSGASCRRSSCRSSWWRRWSDFVLERFLFRYLRTAPTVAKLVTSLGLLVAGPEIVKLWFGPGREVQPPTLWPWGDFEIVHPLGDAYPIGATRPPP